MVKTRQGYEDGYHGKRGRGRPSRVHKRDSIPRQKKKPREVPDEKGSKSSYDCRRFWVCPGCRFYEEQGEEKEGLVFVTRRYCHRLHQEVSNLGDFVECRKREGLQ